MAALIEVRVPDLGDFEDVPVIEVLVGPGDAVAAEDVLIVLESEKATMEIPAPSAGTVDRVAVAVDDTVSQGDLILTLSTDGGGGTEEPAGAVDAAEPAGELAIDGAGVYAGPGARRRARELGVDLAGVSGSGHKGRITREDVAAAAAPAAPPPATPDDGALPARADLPPWPVVDFARYGPIETVELSRIRRIAGPLLARNWVAIPHVTQHDEADITELEAFRREINAAHADGGVKVTMVSLLLKACAAALRAFPEFNSSLDGGALVLKRYHHLGFAVDTPQGLVVPVIRDVDRKGLLQIAGELAELSGAAREGRLSSDQMRGGTFTISSLGGIGGTAFTPIINAPEVAILGVSRSATKPVWLDGEFRPRLVLPLSLSYDHRVVDGAAAARFTTHLGRLLADPRRMLL
ncbi:MAG: hypothetical protein QOK40_3705 [Miltoncostaeaceae bacterium]|nr:hypothetical protein [Miltoncostaeaceae bacterium]